MSEFNKWGEKLKIIAAAPLGTAVFFMFSFWLQCFEVGLCIVVHRAPWAIHSYWALPSALVHAQGCIVHAFFCNFVQNFMCCWKLPSKARSIEAVFAMREWRVRIAILFIFLLIFSHPFLYLDNSTIMEMK